MQYVSSFMASLAIDDLDVAVEELRHLLEIPPNERGIGWLHEVCIYSRFVHINVWSDRPPVEEVRKEIIDELLTKAEIAVCQLINSERLPSFEKPDARSFHENIQLRIQNLENNYLKLLPSDFDPAEEEPRLLTQPGTTA